MLKTKNKFCTIQNLFENFIESIRSSFVSFYRNGSILRLFTFEREDEVHAENSVIRGDIHIAVIFAGDKIHALYTEAVIPLVFGRSRQTVLENYFAVVKILYMNG